MKKIAFFILVLALVIGSVAILKTQAQTKNPDLKTTPPVKPVNEITTIIPTDKAKATATPAKVTPKNTAAVKTSVAKSAVKTTAVKAAPKVTLKTTKTAVKPAATGVRWASSGLKAVSRIPSGVRPAYKKKVEAYARRNNIKLITSTVVASMRE